MSLIQNIPTLEQALDDVEARFLYNLPRSELEHTERLFFQIEQAYWFYEDFKADVFKNLPHFSNLKSFATKLFAHSALLSKVGDKFQELFSDFKSYKSKIPVFGVIMLNPKMTKAVLVCDYGSKSWTFPRGKINENETEFSCAIREVQEETGFDSGPHCREEDQLVAFNEGKQIKMYLACNVPESTIFTIMTRKEISEVSFHPLDALPKTYAVVPFLEKLKRWISQRRKRNLSAQKSPFLTAVKSPGRNNNNNKADANNGTSTAITSTSTSGNLSAVAVAAAAGPVPSSRALRKAAAAASERSPVLHSSSPNLTALNAPNTAGAGHASPSAAKRMRNLFDQRNGDTFESEDSKGWGVTAMFAANSKITGKNYSYDGNPHQFGASHPKYVNYTSQEDAVSSRSVFGGNNNNSPLMPSLSGAGTLSPIPHHLEEPGSNNNRHHPRGGSGFVRGIAASYSENNLHDDSFRELSEQSLRNQSLLRSDQPGREQRAPTQYTPTATATATDTENVASYSYNNNRPIEFALPPTSTSAFQFDLSQHKTHRHDSFDSTHSKEEKSAYSSEACKVIFPVNFKLDRSAVMAAFDKAMRSS